MKRANNPLILFVFLLRISTPPNCCSTTRQASYNDGLPIFSQDELIRPYTKLGRIQVTREVYGTNYSLTPDIKTWGLAAVRQEAEEMGADAIVLPEVAGHTIS